MGLTQADLAAEMTVRLGREIRPLTVTRLEGGKRPIGVDELVAAAGALQIAPADLLSDKALKMGAVRAMSASQELARTSNEVQRAVREWTWAHTRMQSVLRNPKVLEQLSPQSRSWLKIVAAQELSRLVEEAEEEAIQSIYTSTEDSGDDDPDS